IKKQPKVEQQQEVDKNLPIPRISFNQREGRRRSLPPITATVSDDGAPNPPGTPPAPG
ncbi:hypothetical protein CEXT_339501, partial [Caerostris extrusa]